MKGIIVMCLKELVETQAGKDAWGRIVATTDLNPHHTIVASADVEDAKVVQIIQTICRDLGLTLEQAADAFGDYWVNTFAPRIYSSVYGRFKDTRSFLLGMDEVHRQATSWLPNSRPPRFTYDWKDDKTLIIGYDSHRGLVDILVGLIRGVGKRFKEKILVTKLGPDSVRVVFT